MSRSASSRISVIMPTFNREAFVAAALDSVLAQSRPVDEIVVVDDGSTDGTRSIVDAYGPPVRYVRQDNGGKMSAIEHGLRLVSGDLVWIMDDDDLATPSAMAALSAPLDADPAVAYAYGHLQKFTVDDDGREVPGARSSYPVDDPRPFLLKLMEDCFITGHPCVLARRDAVEAAIALNLRVPSSVDYFFFLNMAVGRPVAFVDELVLHQRQHSGLRGPVANRYGESERVARWKETDRVLIRSLLSRMSIADFYPAARGPGDLAPLDRRVALIQRASIEARKQFWDNALADLEAAFRTAPETPLGPAELALLPKLMGCRYGVPEVHEDPTILARLVPILRLRRGEAHIAGQVGRPLLYLAKNALVARDRKEFLAFLRAWSRLMDLRSGSAAAVASTRRVLRRFRPGRPAATPGPGGRPAPGTKGTS